MACRPSTVMVSHWSMGSGVQPGITPVTEAIQSVFDMPAGTVVENAWTAI